MSDRVAHLITSECEVSISFDGGVARVRIAEKNPDLINTCQFEIEGDPKHIAEALATTAAVLVEIESQSRKEPN